MMEITSLAGLEKPMVKLIEVCSVGLGAVARPWLIKRDARALAAANEILNSSGMLVEGASLPSLESQIEQRVNLTETRRQRNLLQITEHARDGLPDDVSDDPVDEDWATRFFSSAQDVSDTQLQQLWGKLLSGEVAKPGSASFRTLDILRNLSRTEAEAFCKLGTQLATDGRWLPSGSECLSRTELRQLQDAGIVEESEHMLGWEDVVDGNPSSGPFNESPGEATIRYPSGHSIIITKGRGHMQMVSVFRLRTSAYPLANLISIETSLSYLRAVIEALNERDGLDAVLREPRTEAV